MLSSWKPWLGFLRDGLIQVLPGFMARRLVGRYHFAFIAHPLTLDDLTRQYPNLKSAPQGFLKRFSRYAWPIFGPDITGFRDEQGREVKGKIIFCLMSTRILVMHRKPALRRLVGCVRMAEKLGVRTIGLGAFVPIVTHDGKLLAKKTKKNLTTGTSFSSIIAVTNAVRAARKLGVDLRKSTIAVVGAGGSVGSIAARLFADLSDRLILVDKRTDAVAQMLNGPYFGGLEGKVISMTTDIRAIREADIILTATNAPGVIVRSDHLKPGAIVVDAAQPRNVSAKVPFERRDVIVIESGIADFPGLHTNFEFDLRSYSEVYSCLAEVLILNYMNIPGQHVGHFALEYVYRLKELAPKIGIDIPRFRNRSGYVSEEDFERVRQILVAGLNTERRFSSEDPAPDTQRRYETLYN